MAISPRSDLLCLLEGTRFLGRRPWTSLGLAALGMMLSALAPLLQVRAGLPDDLLVGSALTFVAVLPLEMFFLPRFLMAADAGAGPHPGNAPGEWKQHFEQRWLRAFAAKALLWTAAFLGLLCFILPGLLVLLAFGWAPLRVLLRGDSLLEAAKASLRIMARAWQRVVWATLVLVLAYVTLGLLLATGLSLFVPAATVKLRLVHPALWVGNFIATLLNLWFTACFLALFQRVETAATEGHPEQPRIP